MDFLAVFALIEKGLTVIGALIEAGKEAAPAIDALKSFITGAKSGTVSDDELTKMDTLLDGLLEDFNKDIEADQTAGSVPDVGKRV